MSFVGLYTGLSGLRAAQTGIDVASHNVANANTPGYTRQRVELAARPAYQSTVGQMGTGVDVQSIARLRDAFLDDRFRTAVGDEREAVVRGDLLASLERLAGEPDHGLSVLFGRLWDAAEDWANDPADPATRRQVLSELGAIAEGFRTTANAWAALGADTEARRDTVVDEINDTLARIHELDTRIANADPKRVGPDLFDQRDLLLDRIAGLTGATARIGADGRSEVTLDGEALVTENGSAAVAVDGDDVTVTPPGGAGVVVTAGGELGGLQRFLTDDLSSWQGALNGLATAFAVEINGLNQGGVTADGQDGVALLDLDGNDPAGTLALTTDDIADLAAAIDGDPGDPPPPHDASNALRFADLRSQRFADPGDDPLDAVLSDLVVELAAEVRTARANAQTARGIGTGAALARAAEHGVSLDEEMVDLVRFQRALEAAARVMTTVDEALEVLVNRVGIVGR